MNRKNYQSEGELVILRVIGRDQKTPFRNLHATTDFINNYPEHINTLISWGLVRVGKKRKKRYKLTVQGQEVLKYLDELDEKTDKSWTTSIGTVRDMDTFCVCVMHHKKH